jgi:hypothetical protein
MIRMPKRFSIVRTGDSKKVVAAHQSAYRQRHLRQWH